MESFSSFHTIAIISTGILLLYTLNLIRINKLSAHLAVSWIVTELFIGIILSIKDIPIILEKFIGKEYTSSFFLFLIIGWIILLMLDTLTRVSALTEKNRSAIQENALLREKIEKLEKLIEK